MAVTVARPTFEDAVLQAKIRQLRHVDNHTNLVYLAIEYLSMVVVIGCTVIFREYRGQWGLAWAWNIPVFAMAIVLIGGLQHRLAGLGHESSHYSFMRNRYLNDLIPDIFCMFPLMTTIHFYRLFHLGHHQYTNDPERDPDLLNLGHGKRAGDFPMSRTRFITRVYFAFIVAPLRFLHYQRRVREGQHVRLGPECLHRASFREAGGPIRPMSPGDHAWHRLHRGVLRRLAVPRRQSTESCSWRLRGSPESPPSRWSFTCCRTGRYIDRPCVRFTLPGSRACSG